MTMDLLRFSTAGSVDDGKSTLIGRLLFDSKGIFEDQLAAIERTSRRRGYTQVDLALLTDGLRAEREQGITIDVAYRYFATPRRKFIIADTPGHVQYTRNMVTGASTADLAIVLVDARKGVARAAQAPRLHRRRCWASRTSSWRSTRWTSSATPRRSSSASRNEFADVGAEAGRPRHPVHPDQRAARRQRRRRVRWRCPGTRARRCSTTWSTSTSARTGT